MSIKINCKEDLFPVKDLIPNPANDKIHTKGKVKNLAEAISEFGFDQAIVANVEDRTITKGHGRYLAAIYLKMTHVPVCFVKYESVGQQLAALKSDNESSTFEYGLDKDKTRELIKMIPDKLKQLAMPDFTKIADIMRFDNHITTQPRLVPQDATKPMPQSNQPVLTSVEDMKAVSSSSSFDDDYSFGGSEPAQENTSQAPKVHYKNLIIRVESQIHEEVRKKLDAYFRENDIPALFL